MPGGAGQRRGRDIDDEQQSSHGYYNHGRTQEYYQQRPYYAEQGKTDGPGPEPPRQQPPRGGPPGGPGPSGPPRQMPPPLGYDPGRIDSVPVVKSRITNTRVELPPEAANLDRKFTNELPVRPGYNTSGKAIAIRVNQYKVTKFPDADIGQYDINYGIDTKEGDKPPAAGLLMAIYKSEPVQRALQQHANIWLWDGQKLVWSLATVPEIRVHVDLDKLRNRPVHPKLGPQVFYVKIVRTKSVRMGVIRGYLEQQMEFDNSVYEGINFLDHLLREYPSTHPNELVAQKRSYFSRGVRPVALDTVVSAAKGVYSSIRLCDPKSGGSGLAINVDVANGTFWTGQDLHQSIRNMMQLVLNSRSLDYHGLAQRLAPRPMSNGRLGTPECWKELRKYAKLKFRLKCPPLAGQHPNPKLAQQKIFTIQGVAFDPTLGPAGCNAKTKVFEITDKKTGAKRTLSVFEHFKQKYGFICNYPLLPLIETTKDGFIPMEACELLGYQKYQFKLDPNQTAAMIKFAVTRPKQRLESIHTGVDMLKWGTDPNLKEFGLQMEKNFTVTNARLLQNPEIQFKGSKINPGTAGRWDLRGKKLWTPNQQPLKSWGVLVIDNCADEPIVKNFMNVFIQTYIGHGGNIVNKNPIIHPSPPRTDHVANAAKLRNAVGNANQMAPQIIFIIMSNRDSFLYERLKRCMECRFGMVSQMIAVNHCRKAAPQYCSNVSMKVNAKLGGITCKNASPNPKAFPTPTMIIGADVSHPSPGSPQPSIAAITMSMDPDCLKFAAHVQSNGRRVEMISEDNIQKGFMQMFAYWIETARTGPSHIYYFRDGVSEGQYKAVLEDEVGLMKSYLIEKYKEKGASIKWTVTVCSKRHHVRFFPKDGDMQAGDKNGNALPGTLVERDVTHPFQYDFYLSSHSAIQGTARPTHYHVIQDEANLNPVNFQNMVYKHCYQYARSTTPVSLYPAVYYAHLASNRARCHMPDDAREGPTGGEKFEEKRADDVVRRAAGMLPSKGTRSQASADKKTKMPPLVPLAADSKDPNFIKAIRCSMWYI